MNSTQKAAFDAYLEAVYDRIKAEKLKLPAPTNYDPALEAVRGAGVDLNAHVMWLATSIDVIHTFVRATPPLLEDSFVYEGVLLRDEKEHELLIFSGDIAADYREGLLRCFGSVDPGSSCWMVVARSKILEIVDDLALGSLLAYKEGFGHQSHDSKRRGEEQPA